MSVPVHISSKQVPEARALKGTINTLAGRLARASDRMVRECSVKIEADRVSRADHFYVAVELRFADDEVVGARDSSNRLDRALYEAFDAARLELRGERVAVDGTYLVAARDPRRPMTL